MFTSYDFRISRREAPDGNTGGQIYYAKIIVDGVLVRDFIPVRVGQIGYLYDKVSGELFGNQGSGNFTLGPDKVNSSSFRYVRMNIAKIRTTSENVI